MRRKRHSPEQIVRKLREAEAELSRGSPLDRVCRRAGISEATYHRWKKQYGGMKVDGVKRLRELEKENARPKRLLAERDLENDVLKEALSKNF